MSDIINVNQQLESMIYSKIRPCYGKEIERFFQSTDGNFNFESLKIYVENLKSGNYAASTINKHISALKNMIRILFDDPNLTILQKYEIDRALKELKQVKENKNKNAVTSEQILSAKEVDVLTNNSPIRTALIIEFLYMTGCRIGETCNIELADCMQNGHTTIRLLGKGNKERKIQISNSLYTRIIKIFHGRTYLFESKSGNKLHDRNIDKELRRLGLKHLQRSISPHMFRHSFATSMIEQTGKIQAVSEYLGHSSTAITLDLYTHETLTLDELFKDN